MYSYQSPFAYAANNPIYYVDYMGMGPKEWWENFKGWVNINIMGKSYSGRDLVKPEKEERTVVYTRTTSIFPEQKTETWHRNDSRWGMPYTHRTGFDFSSFSHVKAQGVVIPASTFTGRLTVSGDRVIGNREKSIFNVRSDRRARVIRPIRRFMGLNLGNRTYVTYNGRHPERPVLSAEDQLWYDNYNQQFGLVDSGLRPIFSNEAHYQIVLRLHGTKAYFKELIRAGIIEPFTIE